MSCTSLAGCCCGTKRASKHQKPDSTKEDVGISAKLNFLRRGEGLKDKLFTYPISKKILRISSRTLRSGCRAPPFVGIPSASKLYFLKVDVFHAPLQRWLASSKSYKRACVRREHLHCEICLRLRSGRAEIWPFLNGKPLPLPVHTYQRRTLPTVSP